MESKMKIVVYRDLGDEGRWFYGVYKTLQGAYEATRALGYEAKVCWAEDVEALEIQNLPDSL